MAVDAEVEREEEVVAIEEGVRRRREGVRGLCNCPRMGGKVGGDETVPLWGWSTLPCAAKVN